MYGFNSKQNVPPNLIQGYRVGARSNDKLQLTLPNGSNTNVEIYMADNELSSTSFANSASRAHSPQIKAQKDTGKELKIKPPEINIQSAQQIVNDVSITSKEGVARMENVWLSPMK